MTEVHRNFGDFPSHHDLKRPRNLISKNVVTVDLLGRVSLMNSVEKKRRKAAKRREKDMENWTHRNKQKMRKR